MKVLETKKAVRQAIDRWKNKANKISEQSLNDVNKGIDSKVERLVEDKDTINKDASTVKQNIKDEIFKRDEQGRKCVQDEITKATEIIKDNIEGFLGIDFEG